MVTLQSVVNHTKILEGLGNGLKAVGGGALKGVKFVGTVAGDDTVFAAVENEEAGDRIRSRVERLL